MGKDEKARVRGTGEKDENDAQQRSLISIAGGLFF